MARKETGTVFTSESTNHNANPNGDTPKLISKEGQKLASVSAPCDAFHIYKSSTAAVREK